MTDVAPAESSEPADGSAGDDEGFSGILSAFRYAYSRSDSRLFRTYVAGSALFGAFVSVLLLSTLAVWFVSTLGESALTTTSNSFLGVIALFILIPLFAPVLFVAREHRAAPGDHRRRDFALALAGYCFVASLYVGLVISVPPEYQGGGGGAVAAFLYSLPQLAGLAPPVLGAAVILLVHRATR